MKKIVSTKMAPEKEEKEKITVYVLFVCMVAASGGLIYGYELGITGGVTSMAEFLDKFFPRLAANQSSLTSYCQFNDQFLQLFTSVLFLAGLIGSFVACWITQRWGRRPSMLSGGISCILGGILNAFALNLPMLIFGRVLLGIGLGFANQAVPLYLSEMAPTSLRGALNICFQLAVTTGILIASLVNYGTGKMTHWGWRVSLGLAVVPGAILTIGTIFLPETPNSLVERRKLDQGKAVLRRIRGKFDVDAEYDDILAASTQAQMIKDPFRTLFTRRYRPQLCIATFIPFFQQVTGINAIMFYAPVIFKTVGFGNNAALYSSVITGAVNVVATFVSIATVDRWGRKILFWQGGLQMFVGQVAIACILKLYLSEDPTAPPLPMLYSSMLVALICIYVAAFAWSWGPLGWLVPSEVFPLEIRSAAQTVTVFVNLFFSFCLGQAFLSLLCLFKWGIFFFFGGWVLIMTLFITLLLPETKNVHIEDMEKLWANHWYWKRFVNEPDIGAEPTKPAFKETYFV